MANEAENSVEITDFHGLVTNADPKDLPEGASVNQVNCVCVVPGELRVRQGMVRVNFED